VTTGSGNYARWGVSESYDRYGNRLNQTATAGAPPQGSVVVDPTTNRITGTGYSFDASGNMTNDGPNMNTIVYDGENRATSSTATATSGAYTFDGNGRRVKKVAGSTTTVYIFSGSKVIAEYDNGAVPGSPTREYVYGGSVLLAKIDSSGTKYYHQDHLSNRLVTDSSGNTSAQMGHYPFGETWYNASNDKLVFTTYERDSESGNDYAQARMYVSRLARFSSPDPLAGSASTPQSWNRYSYVMDNPVNSTDPTGMYCQWDDGTRDDPEADGGAGAVSCVEQGGEWKSQCGIDTICTTVDVPGMPGGWVNGHPVWGLMDASQTQAPPNILVYHTVAEWDDVHGKPPMHLYVPPWIPGKQFNKFNTGPFSGPYRPPSSPQPPETPINPTEPPPVFDPPPPGGLPETIEPTPFTTSPAPPETIPGLSRIVGIIEGIFGALSNISDPIITIRPPCRDCT